MNAWILGVLLAAGAPNLVQVDLVFTGEIAGLFQVREARWINPDFPPLIGGAASLKTYLDQVRAEAKQDGAAFFLLDAGGSLGGNLMGEGSNPRLTAGILNLLGYDLKNVGIRDLYRGAAGLKEMARVARFPLLSANLRERQDTTTPPPYLRPYWILEAHGLRIGVFGLITEEAPIFLLNHHLQPFYVARDVATARAMVAELRKQGADFIVALTNLGVSRDTMLARVVPGIDLIIGSFDGRGMREAYEDPTNHTIVVRTYSGLSDVGRIRLFFDPETRTLVRYEYQETSLFVDEFPPDPDLLQVVQRGMPAPATAPRVKAATAQ